MTGKGSFYIAQYPVRWTAQSALHFLPSLADLFIPTPFSASPGSILAMQQLCATTKSLTFPPLSIARYSFIQLSQQGRQWREGKCPIFQTVAKGDSNPGSLDCESGVLPLATALHVVPLTSATDTLLIAINCKWLQSIEMSCVINFLALPFLCVPSAYMSSAAPKRQWALVSLALVQVNRLTPDLYMYMHHWLQCLFIMFVFL